MTNPHVRPFRVARFCLLLAAVVLVGAGCLKSSQPEPPQPFVLQVWSVDQSETELRPFLDRYTASYPYVTFEVRTLEAGDYEEALFDAWARGEGPDIFVVDNWRLGRFRDVIAPLPASVKLKTITAEGKKSSLGSAKITITETDVQQLVPSQIPNLFVGPVAGDVVLDDQVLGLPLSMDTLALYYNRDIMTQAQVAVPPTTWNDFLQAVQAMVVTADEADTADETLVRPAAGIGGFDNVPHAFDILSALMMQNGVTMVDPGNGRIVFNDGESLDGSRLAIDFYRKFADPKFESYTWDDQQPGALELFTQGNLGMYFGYLRDEAVIKQRAGTLNFSRTALPQINPDAPINYANYPVMTVFLKGAHTDHAWNAVRFMTTEESLQESYLEATGRVSALRTIVAKQQSDPEVDLFARQAITAQTWYHGNDPEATLAAVESLITTAVTDTAPLEDIIDLAARSINLTLAP